MKNWWRNSAYCDCILINLATKSISLHNNVKVGIFLTKGAKINATLSFQLLICYLHTILSIHKLWCDVKCKIFYKCFTISNYINLKMLGAKMELSLGFLAFLVWNTPHTLKIEIWGSPLKNLVSNSIDGLLGANLLVFG